MSCENWLYVLLLVAIATQLSTAGDFDNCKLFTPIPEANYSVDPALVTEIRGRPLGYNWSVIPFNDPQRTNPCFTVHFNGSKTQAIEVMAQDVVGSSTFCVKSNQPHVQATCQSGIRTCTGSPVGAGINETKYVFFCNGCETDITFWFRITVSPSFNDGVELENWCIRTTRYPKSLIPEPRLPDTTLPPTSKCVGLENGCNRTSQHPTSHIPEPSDVPEATTVSTSTIKKCAEWENGCSRKPSDMPEATSPPTSGSCFVSRTFLWLFLLNFLPFVPFASIFDARRHHYSNIF